MHALAWDWIYANVRAGVRLVHADVGVASCSSHLLCSYTCTLGSISSGYPDSANVKDILLVVPSS
jgi:hypothetical protein